MNEMTPFPPLLLLIYIYKENQNSTLICIPIWEELGVFALKCISLFKKIDYEYDIDFIKCTLPWTVIQ